MDSVLSGRIRDLLFDSVAHMSKKQEVEEFFDEFFTPVEKIMFAKRLAIAILLLKGYGYGSINQTLKVCSGTIDKVNYWIKYSGKHFKKMAERIIQKEKDEESWHNFMYSIESATVGMSRGNWSERRRNLEQNHRSFERKHVI